MNLFRRKYTGPTWPPKEPAGGWALPEGASFTTPVGMIEDAQMRAGNDRTEFNREHRMDTELTEVLQPKRDRNERDE